MGRDRGLAFQATLQVQPADKRLSLVFRISLVIDTSLIERFDSDEASNLLARKTHVFEPSITRLPGSVVRLGWELLSEFHSHPPVSEPPGAGCATANARIKLKDSYLAGLLSTNIKALLLHVGDSTLLHGIEPIHQGAVAIDHIGEIVTDVGIDLAGGRPPLEIDIYLRAHLL